MASMTTWGCGAVAIVTRVALALLLLLLPGCLAEVVA